MKREGIPTQRLEEKRVEECVGEGEREREKKREREKECTHAGEKERERVLWLFLLYVFASTWAYSMQIGLSQECCLFYLKSSLWSSDLPLTLLVFFSHRHFGLLSPILPT